MANFNNVTKVELATSASRFEYGPIATGTQFSTAGFVVHRNFAETGNAIIHVMIEDATPFDARTIRAELRPGWTWERDNQRALVLEAGMTLIVETDEDVEVTLTGVLRSP